MIVTIEDLEQGVWCPDARVRAEGGSKDRPGNRIIANGKVAASSIKPFCCIGPGCMAWRWYEKEVSGYCGRAGVPVQLTASVEKKK